MLLRKFVKKFTKRVKKENEVAKRSERSQSFVFSDRDQPRFMVLEDEDYNHIQT